MTCTSIRATRWMPPPRAHAPRRHRPTSSPLASVSVFNRGPKMAGRSAPCSWLDRWILPMVSDHAELIGEVQICNTPEVEGYNAWECRLYRTWPRAAFYLFNYMSAMQQTHLGLCGEDDALCLRAALKPWQEMQEAAERYYDRSSECSFTTFVGYEWTGMNPSSGGNLHRNVVFRNTEVPHLPASFIDEPSAQDLWGSLDETCNQTGGRLRLPGDTPQLEHECGRYVQQPDGRWQANEQGVCGDARALRATGGDHAA